MKIIKKRNQDPGYVKKKQMYSQKYREENKEKIKAIKAIYHIDNKEKNNKKSKNHYKQNKEKYIEYGKKYGQENREFLNKKAAERSSYRRKTDICFKIRCNVSGSIYKALHDSGSCKSEESSIKYLNKIESNYIEKLKNHLESQFIEHMSWENWGRYNVKTWNDNDPSTFTWQIDHICPASDFYYTSMEDEQFKLCWRLKNLRPLWSKQNLLDGVNRTRHGKTLEEIIGILEDNENEGDKW